MALLDIQGLSLSINGALILQDVSLAIEPGETLGLVGESGSGKSMTALSVMRLLPRGAQTNGSIRFDGQDLAALPEPDMCRIRGRRVGMIFQEPMTALNPLKTVGDQVAEGFVLHLRLTRAEAARRAQAVLERVGLPATEISLGRYPHELSGGQRQRVVIAMAVALAPPLLIADEPTTALDVTTQAQILKLLRELIRENGSSLLLITHDLSVVNAMADRVAIMRAGEIVEQGRGGGLSGAITHPYAKALLNASSLPPRVTSAAAPTSRPILEVKNLVRAYALPRRSLFRAAPRRLAVDNVSFTVAKGESLGLVGESGCGKSTTARAILALEAVQGGSIAFAGQDTSKLRGAEMAAFRRRVQMVFQDPYGSFDPRHKAGRIVGEPLRLLGRECDPQSARRRVDEALTEVGLDPADADKYPHEFSGGQRQRLAIARALITRPDLIVLDEPVSALDVSVRAQVLKLLTELQKRLGLTYLFISHDLAVVRAITDRVLVMRAGKVVEAGPTPKVLGAPEHPYTRELVAASLHLDAILSERTAASLPDAAGC
ncbi:ABC transporter ATP-binding protein [Alsobacter metallidurans]|uniref:ABC transporter ATP-binding protein n=1 Tax=Alsobacter metallidurans TaxID=340221 RepID=A0A917I5T2_9HYPH|nr:dipeptide ABC transporter ATP-binding protein [Alsobacter metallidurans]GGH14197.1 ABC transporter ATP-binding protein [Alsobacter metallidurans]